MPTFGANPAGAACQPCASQTTPSSVVGSGGPPGQSQNKKTHWIEIKLNFDDNGDPAAGESFMITLPDGVEVHGSLDKDGKARVNGIENPGSCKVTFPKLDKTLWKSG